jgi:hypothetical protein
VRLLIALVLLAGCASAATLEQRSARGELAAGCLGKMRERPLVPAAGTHVLRMLVEPGWQRPTAHRVVVHRRGSGTLYFRKLNWCDSERPWLMAARRVHLTRRQVARLLALLDEMHFWFVGPRMARSSAIHPTFLSLEVTRDGRHRELWGHAVDRHLWAVSQLLARYARLAR